RWPSGFDLVRLAGGEIEVRDGEASSASRTLLDRNAVQSDDPLDLDHLSERFTDPVARIGLERAVHALRELWTEEREARCGAACGEHRQQNALTHARHLFELPRRRVD